MDSPGPTIVQQLETLETRSAHQELVIAELNEAITAQWRKIDALEWQLKQLKDELQSMSFPKDGNEAPPPHY